MGGLEPEQGGLPDPAFLIRHEPREERDDFRDVTAVPGQGKRGRGSDLGVGIVHQGKQNSVRVLALDLGQFV